MPYILNLPDDNLRPYEATIQKCDATYGENTGDDAAWISCYNLGAAKEDAAAIPSIRACVDGRGAGTSEEAAMLGCASVLVNATREKCRIDGVQIKASGAGLDEQTTAEEKCWLAAGFQGPFAYVSDWRIP